MVFYLIRPCFGSVLFSTDLDLAQDHNSYYVTSVVDPNTLNLDPVPEFWHNLDTDPGLFFSILK